jgi:hypothetical protein
MICIVSSRVMRQSSGHCATSKSMRYVGKLMAGRRCHTPTASREYTTQCARTWSSTSDDAAWTATPASSSFMSCRPIFPPAMASATTIRVIAMYGVYMDATCHLPRTKRARAKYRKHRAPRPRAASRAPPSRALPLLSPSPRAARLRHSRLQARLQSPRTSR